MAKIKLRKSFRALLFFTNIILYCLVLSIDYTPWFYKSVSLSNRAGMTILIKEYAWGHSVYGIVLLCYTFTTLITLIYALTKRKQVPYKSLCTMAAISVLSLAITFIGRVAVNGNDPTPFNYCIANMFILIITYRTPLYNVDEALMTSFVKRKDAAYILIDKQLNYMGSSDPAKNFIPEIGLLRIDKPFLQINSPELNLIENWITSYTPENDTEIRELSCNDMELTVNIQYLYHKSKVRGYIITLNDDHVRQEQIQLLNKVSENKSRFLSDVSHEIRTPINSVLGMNEMILREATNAQIIDYANCIDAAGKTLLNLINDILDLSRIESGKLELHSVNYSLRDLLIDIKRLMAPLVAEKNLQFQIILDEQLPNQLFGDGPRIKQMLVNLLTNAVKYTDSGSITFTIEGTVENDILTICFQIKDTGRGIKPEDIPHLFTAYERVDEVKNTGILGTGLGLSITKKFADMMDGTIEVESEYEKGSTFILTVNQTVTDSQPIGNINIENTEKKTTAKTELFHAPDARILSVDDTAMNQKVLSHLLKRTQIQLDLAYSGAECLGLLAMNQYDLILLDHMMPEMDGVETLNQIKEKNLAPHTPVIALTANAIGDARSHYLELGFNGYLSKPINSVSLEKLLIDCLPKDKLLNSTQSD